MTNLTGDQPIQLPAVTVVATNEWERAALQTPNSLTTASGEQLEAAGIDSVLDLQRAIPNLSLARAGLRSVSDNYTLRGLGNTEFLSAPAVVLYVDDAPFGDIVTYATDLLAIDHVDVYRGPQGSRFGKNAEAGVINIVTRQPTDQFETEASVSEASFNTQTYRVLEMGPVAKGKLYFGLAGQYARSDGFIRNTFKHSDAAEQEAINGRGTLRWTPDDVWDVNFTAAVDHYDDGFGIVPLNGRWRETATETDPKIRRDANRQSLRVRGTLPAVTVTSITTRQDSRLHPFKIDPDFSPLPGNTGMVNQVDTQWSEELRVQPTETVGPWDWHAGFFFATADKGIHRPEDFFVPAVPISGRDVIDSSQTANTYALLGEVTHTVADKLDITPAVRLDYTAAEMHRTRDSTLGSPPPVDADAGFFNAAPKLTLAYHVRDTMLVYLSTGMGFKPGGLSELIDPPRSPKFQTETVWASELGEKSTWLDDKLTANVSAFYYDITDYQVEQIVPPGFDNTVVNAPHAQSLGAEIELTGRPVVGWELSGFFGCTDAQLERYTNPFTGVTVHHTHPPFVAAFNAGAAVEHKHKNGFFERMGVSFLGDTYADAANTPAFKQSAYGLLDARVGYQREHFGIFLFGENLTDTHYYSKKIYSLNGGAPGQPQTFGVTVTASF